MNCGTRTRCHPGAGPGAGIAALLASMSIALAAASAHAQRADDGTDERPPSGRESAPIDITGHWVSLITDDWVYRMITPEKGDYSYVPLNAAGRRAADTWDPARDTAAGEECKSYSAPAIMRLPSRVHITWENDARQTEHVLAEIGQDQVRRDRRDLVEARLAELALDIVFLGEAEAAVGLHAGVGRLHEASAASSLAMLASAPQFSPASNSARAPPSPSGRPPRIWA
jgi:hypothetical protein